MKAAAKRPRCRRQRGGAGFARSPSYDRQPGRRPVGCAPVARDPAAGQGESRGCVGERDRPGGQRRDGLVAVLPGFATGR